ncbi:hypothetical protein BHE74_00038064 [Ensete ventricosum]|nr:hypothetical protein BHE74_00038064 [Ensete ventricosum]RZS09249.1 hypothetical protein BHM03_00040327 [Ensete ventricosum]
MLAVTSASSFLTDHGPPLLRMPSNCQPAVASVIIKRGGTEEKRTSHRNRGRDCSAPPGSSSIGGLYSPSSHSCGGLTAEIM